MSTYPSVVATLTDPNASSYLNSPSHSSIHSSENAEIKQIQTFVGTLSSAVGTLVYDIRAAASGGGGHVQAANLGGTGQTNFNKGDILVATSSSVISKLAVSSVTGQVLTVDPTQVAGIKWGAAAASTKIVANQSVVSVSDGPASALTVYFATSVLGSTLGTNNAVRFTGNITSFSIADSQKWNASVLYGNNYLGNIGISVSTSIFGAAGTIEGMIIGNGGGSSQVSMTKTFVSENTGQGMQAVSQLRRAYSYITGASSVESSANQDLILKGSFSNADANNSISTGIFVVEQIK